MFLLFFWLACVLQGMCICIRVCYMNTWKGTCGDGSIFRRPCTRAILWLGRPHAVHAGMFAAGHMKGACMECYTFNVCCRAHEGHMQQCICNFIFWRPARGPSCC